MAPDQFVFSPCSHPRCTLFAYNKRRLPRLREVRLYAPRCKSHARQFTFREITARLCRRPLPPSTFHPRDYCTGLFLPGQPKHKLPPLSDDFMSPYTSYLYFYTELGMLSMLPLSSRLSPAPPSWTIIVGIFRPTTCCNATGMLHHPRLAAWRIRRGPVSYLMYVVLQIRDREGYADQIMLEPSPEFRGGGPVGRHRRRPARR